MAAVFYILIMRFSGLGPSLLRSSPHLSLADSLLSFYNYSIMLEPLISRKAPILAGLVVSICGLFWIMTLPYKPTDIFSRIGMFSAFICVMGAVIFFWAAIFAYAVRKWSWLPRSYALPGLILWIPAFYFYLLSNNPRSWSIGAMLMAQSPITAYVCRRLAFPQLTNEQISATQPPPSLFPK
jgi:hypothetical protein